MKDKVFWLLSRVSNEFIIIIILYFHSCLLSNKWCVYNFFRKTGEKGGDRERGKIELWQ